MYFVKFFLCFVNLRLQINSVLLRNTWQPIWAALGQLLLFLGDRCLSLFFLLLGLRWTLVALVVLLCIWVAFVLGRHSLVTHWLSLSRISLFHSNLEIQMISTASQLCSLLHSAPPNVRWQVQHVVAYLFLGPSNASDLDFCLLFLPWTVLLLIKTACLSVAVLLKHEVLSAETTTLI